MVWLKFHLQSCFKNRKPWWGHASYKPHKCWLCSSDSILWCSELSSTSHPAAVQRRGNVMCNREFHSCPANYFCTVNYVEAQQHALLSLEIEFWHLFHNSSIKKRSILRCLWAMEREETPWSCSLLVVGLSSVELIHIAFLPQVAMGSLVIPGSTGACACKHTWCHCRLHSQERVSRRN